MKKVLYLLICCFLLTACHNNGEEFKNKEYQSIVKLIEDKKERDFDSEYPFKIVVSLAKVDGKLEYNLEISEIEYAVDDIKVLVIDQNRQTNDVYPSFGLGDKYYNYIPNQVNLANNFIDKISISDFTSEENLNLKIYVSFIKDSNDVKESYFINYNSLIAKKE